MPLSKAQSGHHYHLGITGEGAPLLLLHGFSGDRATWRAVAPAMSPNYRLIQLDILGHGASDKPAAAEYYRMYAIAADIIDLLDQLQIERTHLLGYSMGGRLALYLALHYRTRFTSLMLESASPGLAKAAEREERRRGDEALADRIEAQGINWFVEYWEGLPLWASQANLPPTLLTEQRRQRLRNDPRGLANSLRGMGAGAQPSLWSRLPTLTIPTLLLAGELDDKFRRVNEAMAEKIPGAKLAILPAAGHNSHLENPAAFTQALRSFLQRL